MNNPSLNNQLNELFHLHIDSSKIDGGQYIEDTLLYKSIYIAVSFYRPTARNIEPLAFDFALKMAAIEFYKGDDHGFYHAEAYKHYFEDGATLFHKEYISLLNHHGLLPGFEVDNIALAKGNVRNPKTEEVLTFDTIEKIGLKWIEYELTIQINTIKLVLYREENRDQIIKLIAGNEKEEYISDATKIFEDIIQL